MTAFPQSYCQSWTYDVISKFEKQKSTLTSKHFRPFPAGSTGGKGLFCPAYNFGGPLAKMSGK